MSHLIDMTGQRFGRLVVIERSGSSKYGRAQWLVQCDCGQMVVTEGASMRSGNSLSCGCAFEESKYIHGHYETPTYKSWANMKNRCQNPNNSRYADYGGRGISVCERWQTFSNFLADMGERLPGTSIDRIDVDGNYEPSNCRWADASTQRRNQRDRIAA